MTTVADTEGGGQPIADPVTFFGLPPTEVLGAYPRRAAHALWARGQSLWDHPTTETAFFLDPRRDRYVIVSVDPAGGGTLSDEVFVVFLVTDNQFGLFTANAFAGQSHGPPSMFPLVTVELGWGWTGEAHTHARKKKRGPRFTILFSEAGPCPRPQHRIRHGTGDIRPVPPPHHPARS